MTTRRALWQWGPVVAWMVLIFALSAQQGLRVSSDATVDGPVRHLAHVVTYAVLAVLLLRALAGDGPTPRLAAIAALMSLLYGVTDEIHQTFVPTRTGQPLDLVWDGMGALLGPTAVLLWHRFRGPSRHA